MQGRSPVGQSEPGRRNGGAALDRPNVCLYFYSLAQRGGAERMLVWLAGQLVARGHHVVIMTLDAPGTHSAFPLPKDAVWHRLARRGDWRGKLQRVRAMHRVLRQHRAGVLVGFVMAADKTVYAAALWARTPLIAAERNDPVIYHQRMRLPQRALYWTLMALCRRVAVQLPVYVNGYPRFLRRRIAVIPNPVPPAPPHIGSGSPEGSGVIVALGRLHPQKGFDLLLAAFSQVAVAYPGWRLRIVGDGAERPALVEQTARLGLTAHVTFVGDLRDPGEELHRGDIFAFPSRYEGFPNALAEAMSRGLPCVAFASCKGAASLLEQGDAGELVVPEESPEAFGRALCQLIAHPEHRHRLGCRAQRITQTYGTDAIAERWVSHIQAATK